MKRTSLQGETNNNKQIRCEFHRVRKLNKERKLNRQLISNFEILYR